MKKVLLTLVALCCVLTSNVFAEEDTRNVITNCTISGYDPSGVKIGDTGRDAGWAIAKNMSAPNGSVYHVETSMACLEKWNEDTHTFANMNSDQVVPGKYRLWVQIRIDTQNGVEYGTQYRFGYPEKGEVTKVIVDGVEWEIANTIIGTTYSALGIYGPEFTVFPEGLNDVSDNTKGKCTKLIRNGQIYIIRDGRTYNALGVEVYEF